MPFCKDMNVCMSVCMNVCIACQFLHLKLYQKKIIKIKTRVEYSKSVIVHTMSATFLSQLPRVKMYVIRIESPRLQAAMLLLYLCRG